MCVGARKGEIRGQMVGHTNYHALLRIGSIRMKYRHRDRRNAGRDCVHPLAAILHYFPSASTNSKTTKIMLRDVTYFIA